MFFSFHAFEFVGNFHLGYKSSPQSTLQLQSFVFKQFFKRTFRYPQATVENVGKKNPEQYVMI